MFDIRDIWNLLPHRYPFLMVDRILELEPGKRAVGLKNVSANESFFQGHFPDQPVLPGVLILEAMAQMVGIAVLSMEEHKGKMGYLAGVDNVRFRRPVHPGDQLMVQAELTNVRGTITYAKCCAKVDEEVAAEGTLILALRTPEEVAQDTQRHAAKACAEPSRSTGKTS